MNVSDAAFLAKGFREMVKSDLQGGTLSINNSAYDCTVGGFSRQDVFMNGGISPHTMGDAQVLLSDLPSDIDLGVGKKLTVIPNTGKVRQCQIHSTQNTGNHISILLWDLNEGA
jgi:hypothetical protein